MRESDIIIYHNPRCATSRNVVGLVRAMGFEPHIIEYLKTPPTPEMLLWLADRAGVSIRDFIRTKEPSYKTEGLDDDTLSDNMIAKKMHDHPELINRPIVVCPKGVAVCRPAEKVTELLILPEE
ncbi:arsenate reductase (glutaredoxin) [uncultured Bartonella sp.]|uniref:arsenate reductase (glutaredoxin) n=1 Tax=uncultured Bartonella sp. TaxID=104108 RepID=UPI00260B818E|nr:arsenate reductase (glutaredoxin) [uncultured Bartonella sp.]